MKNIKLYIWILVGVLVVCIIIFLLNFNLNAIIYNFRFTNYFFNNPEAKKDLKKTIKKFPDPFRWTAAMAELGEKYNNKAKEALAKGDNDTYLKQMYATATFYFVARFPFNGTAEKENAYAKHKEYYLKATNFFPGTFELLKIPFEGKEIIGYLWKPKNVAKPPLVLISGGIDTWKSDVNGDLAELLKQNIAVFAMDMAGTGESQWKLAPDSDRVYSAALQYLKESRTDIDGNHMGVYMVSFSGLYAVKMALVDPNVKAAVNIGGPIHYTFTREHLKTMDDITIRTVCFAMGYELNENYVEKLLANGADFSLLNQKVLKETPNQGALLSINGSKDPIIPIKDLYFISENKVKQETWVYEGDGHCAYKNMRFYRSKAAKWLKDHLK